MKIAIVNPSDEFEIGIKGGNQLIAESLLKYIKKYSSHEVQIIHTPSKAYPNSSLIKSYLMHRLMDFSNFDLVISLKFPSFIIKHNNHICYFAHFYRQFYDLWPIYKKIIKNHSKKLYFQTILTKGIIKLLDKRAFKKIKRVYSYSKFIQSRLKNENINSKLIYCPPPEENFSCNNYDYILSTSILNDERKRISLLIKAMRHIKNDTKLLIAGSGPHEKKLKELAKDDSRIIFLGYKTPKELIDIYSNALCTCLVSYKEDYGLVTIESMKSKKPVITCYDSGGPLEFVEHNKTGLISNPNTKDIAKNLEILINNKKRAKDMGEKGFEKVKDIIWKETIQKLVLNNLQNGR